MYPQNFDAIVIGGGHAGCEAVHALAKMGVRALLLTSNLDSIAKLSCNPSIGGTAKGHMVREIDALGGIMGYLADKTGIHFRMLNDSKGPAVKSPRAQIDKAAYHLAMKELLEKTPNLYLFQGDAEELLIDGNQIKGVATREGIHFYAKAVIITTGTFLKGVMHIGSTSFEGGRSGDNSSKGLSASLIQAGFDLGRLKTGTPPRIHEDSIDFSKTELQPGQRDVKFSFDTKKCRSKQSSCYITHTTAETKAIIGQNLNRSALFSGKIRGKGPRYCPSIEDKIVRFADKETHQLFLEPEGLKTKEYYINGIATSLPFEVQLQIISTIPGLEKAYITRPAYAIEYDYLRSGQINAALESRRIKNLFFAGQINGTTGYEEAAAQGLVAGINAALFLKNKEPFILSRHESYIGVMIDDLIKKELEEPYRMFTSRAEHRLLLRQDNADLRLRHLGYALGLINKRQYDAVCKKKAIIGTEKERLFKTFKQNASLGQILCRPDIGYQNLLNEYPADVSDYGSEINRQIETECKLAGYIAREYKEIEKLQQLEQIKIPADFNYAPIKTLRNEAKEKLIRFAPQNLGAASRILGVSSADIFILMIGLRKRANHATEGKYDHRFVSRVADHQQQPENQA